MSLVCRNDVKEIGAWVVHTGNTITVIAGTDVELRARPNPTVANGYRDVLNGALLRLGYPEGHLGCIQCRWRNLGYGWTLIQKAVIVNVISFHIYEYTETSDTLYCIRWRWVNGEVGRTKSFHFSYVLISIHRRRIPIMRIH
jgi:hypothetical protein